jgi:hypothetical protein
MGAVRLIERYGFGPIELQPDNRRLLNAYSRVDATGLRGWDSRVLQLSVRIGGRAATTGCGLYR